MMYVIMAILGVAVIAQGSALLYYMVMRKVDVYMDGGVLIHASMGPEEVNETLRGVFGHKHSQNAVTASLGIASVIIYRMCDDVVYHKRHQYEQYYIGYSFRLHFVFFVT